MIYSASDTNGVPFQDKLDDLFNSKENGVFIELGANDGLFQSNTAFLEKERNWTGILVEPSEYNFLKCKENRPGSKVYNYACVSNDYKDKHVYGDWEKRVAHGAMASVGGIRLRSDKSSLTKVKAVTLDFILKDAKINEIDLLSLDAEGHELEILKGLDLIKTKPQYMLIEIYKHTEKDITAYLSNYNYSLFSNFSNYNKDKQPGWDGTHQDALYKLNDNISVHK